jgi:hypothetical protein
MEQNVKNSNPINILQNKKNDFDETDQKGRLLCDMDLYFDG